ncbi:MAG: PRD domain-containing protein [Liquorilactobacillus nagelii]|uniref:BglG family transcription antiterminator n=1 Tax=Liquorilactobacillus nagelii TaxID=82688 RepID=UPI0039EA2350
MNEKIKQLLDILLQQNGYLTALQLSEMLGVTERSIRNYVRTLNSSATQEPLIISSNKGYKIQRSLYNESIESSFLIDENADLFFRIILILINQQDFITFDDLAARLNYSVESIRNKVQTLFLKIQDMNLRVSFESRIFTGIRILGIESQKRLLLEQLIPIEKITKSNLVESAFILLGKMIDKQKINAEVNRIDEVFSKYHTTMDFIVYAKIICHMIIVMSRYSTGYFIKLSEIGSNNNADHPEFQLASSLLKMSILPIDNDAEILLLTNYLTALPLNTPGTFTPDMSEFQRKSLESSLKKAEKYYSIPLYSNNRYRAQIINHIMRLLDPLEERIPIFNPYSQKTKREYLFAYSIACFLYDGLKSDFGIQIPESEISYLAIHIQLVLIEETKNNIQTMLVFQGKKAEGELFRYKIKTYFPTIDIKIVSSTLDKSSYLKYQLIIRCGFQKPMLKDSKIIEISKNMNTNDIIKIQNFIETIGTVSLIQQIDYHHMDENTSEAAIEYLLSKSGYFDLLPYFKKREVMSPTDIGHLVAMPHPFLKGSETTAKVIIGINKNEIVWGHQKVRLVIIYIPASDLKTNKIFFNDVYEHTNNLTEVYGLLETKTKEEFIEVWNRNRKGDSLNAL